MSEKDKAFEWSQRWAHTQDALDRERRVSADLRQRLMECQDALIAANNTIIEKNHELIQLRWQAPHNPEGE